MPITETMLNFIPLIF